MAEQYSRISCYVPGFTNKFPIVIDAVAAEWESLAVGGLNAWNRFRLPGFW